MLRSHDGLSRRATSPVPASRASALVRRQGTQPTPMEARMDLSHTVTTHYLTETSADHFDYLEDDQ